MSKPAAAATHQQQQPPPRGLKEPKASVIQNGRKIVTSKFNDGTEMIEEFDVITDDLLVRKRRTEKTLGGETPWEFEVGGEQKAFVADRDLMKESSSNPIFVAQETKEAYVYRVRNLPYPKDTYKVAIETSSSKTGEVVVRTTNKKYYKRIAIQPMERAGLTLDDGYLSWEYKNNTLIVTYKKHLSMLTMQMQEQKERAAMNSTRVTGDGSPDCKQQ